MQGVIAAGSAPTADAGAEVLAEGGNAVDAAVAACFATAVGEPTLTSLAGGGMMIHRDGGTGKVTICDFFSDAPRMGLRDLGEPDFFAIDLDFGPTTQQFHIGAASAAVPGVIPGLCEALGKWGTKPLAEVVAPACRMLREGYLQGPYQGFAAKLLEPILTYTESGRNVFHVDGRMVGEGDLFRLPQLADTLEAMARRGWRSYYEDVLVAAMLEQFGPERGGLLTKEDFDAYQVHFREPLALKYHNSRVLTPPPPAAGGPMIAMMLKLLGTRQLGTIDRTSPRHAGLLACAMAVADESRPEGALALEGARFDHWLEHFVALCETGRLPSAKAPGGPANTTHISVIDQKGDAAAVTFSYGEGNAHVIGDTGIVMNNLMGEDDLFPQGFDFAPRGKRLPTMQRRPPSACAGASQAFRQKVAPFVPLITLGRRRLRSRATCYEQSRLWCTAASGRRGMHGQPTRRSVRPRLRPCVGRWHRWCIAACVQPSTGGPRMRPSGPTSSASCDRR